MYIDAFESGSIVSELKLGAQDAWEQVHQGLLIVHQKVHIHLEQLDFVIHKLSKLYNPFWITI